MNLSHKVDLSLVLACYNEGPTLVNSLKKIVKTLENLKFDWEIICIDDKSKDNTLQTIKNFAAKQKNVTVLAHAENIGRGGTVMEGICLSKGKVVGFIDVDLEVAPIYISEFYDAVISEGDVAIATRIYNEQLSSVIRWLASRGYLFVSKIFLGNHFKDTEAGYKFFNRSKILPIIKLVQDKKWFFDTEIVLRSERADLKIVQIPVLFLRRNDKESTVKLFSDTLAYIKAMRNFNKNNR